MGDLGRRHGATAKCAQHASRHAASPEYALLGNPARPLSKKNAELYGPPSVAREGAAGEPHGSCSASWHPSASGARRMH